MKNRFLHFPAKLGSLILAGALALSASSAAPLSAFAESADDDDAAYAATTSEAGSTSESAEEGDTSSSEEGTQSGSEIVNNFSVNAPNALLIDLDTDEVLYEKNADEQIYPASTTKVMTALIVLEAVENGEISLDDTYTVSEEAVDQYIPSGYVTADLEEGEEISIRDLLYCLLLPSANDAANALACAVSGNVSDFVDRMNQEAERLGCENTHFVTTNGVHDEKHYSTARDLATIAEAAIQYETFREIVATADYEVPATNKSDARTIYNTNYLICSHKTFDYIYRYCTGIKTGLTEQAGHCLISMAEKDGRRVLGVILGEQDEVVDGVKTYPVFDESINLLAHGLDDFSYQTLVEGDAYVTTVPVEYSRDGNSTDVYTASSISALLPVDADLSQVVMEYEVPNVLEAPIEAGTSCGTMEVYYDGVDYGSIDLTADSTLSYSHTLQVAQFMQNRIGWPTDDQLNRILESDRGQQLFDFLDMHPSALRYGMIGVPVLLILIIVLIIAAVVRKNRKKKKAMAEQYQLGGEMTAASDNADTVAEMMKAPKPAQEASNTETPEQPSHAASDVAVKADSADSEASDESNASVPEASNESDSSNPETSGKSEATDTEAETEKTIQTFSEAAPPEAEEKKALIPEESKAEAVSAGTDTKTLETKPEENQDPAEGRKTQNKEAQNKENQQ